MEAQISSRHYNRHTRESAFFAIQQCLEDSANIYNQAHLEQVDPIALSDFPTKVSEKSFALRFNIDGDLNGSIYCLLENKNHRINLLENSQTQSIASESMNILLGRLLTKLNEQFYINSKISAPAKFNTTYFDNFSHSKKVMKVRYKFIANFEEYDFNIFFSLLS